MGGQFTREGMIQDPSSLGGTVLLLTVIVAAGIVASEFSQGTIKMLLTRPVKRWKILLSKFLTVNLFGMFLMVIGYVVYHPFGDSFIQIGGRRKHGLVSLEQESVHAASIIRERLRHCDIRVHDRQRLPLQLTRNRIVVVHLFHRLYDFRVAFEI